MTVTIEVTPPFSKLRPKLNRFRSRVKGQLLNRVAQRVAKHARDRVRTEKGSPDGVSWPARKQPDRFTHPLMEKTGRLYRSIRAVRDSKESINVGSDIPYAFFHHVGTSKMPQRQAIGVGSRDLTDLQQLIDGWVRDYA